MDKTTNGKSILLLGIFLMTSIANASPLVGKMYDYEGIGESFTKQLVHVLAFEGRLEAIKSNKLAFLTDSQIVKVNNALTKIRHIKKIHGKADKNQFYILGRDIVASSFSNINCVTRIVSLATTKTIQLNCKGLGYEIEGDDLFAEYEYSDFFLTTKRSDGAVVVSSYVDGRLTHLEQQITVLDDEVSRVYAPILQANKRTFITPKS
ncbi:hypothetical protein L4D76_23185 [Photobacterium sagamiensis]|uniref:hypothetical protein n=1 Tax=Photobacterium sagamiensis TaxID=2910241 RepID=UPI003D0E3A96